VKVITRLEMVRHGNHHYSNEGNDKRHIPSYLENTMKVG